MVSAARYEGGRWDAEFEMAVIGGHLVSKGEISVGDLTSLLIYTG